MRRAPALKRCWRWTRRPRGRCRGWRCWRCSVAMPTKARELATRALAIDPRDQAAAIAFAQAALRAEGHSRRRTGRGGAVAASRSWRRSIAPSPSALPAMCWMRKTGPRKPLSPIPSPSRFCAKPMRPSWRGLESVRAREMRLAEYFRRADASAWRGAAARPGAIRMFSWSAFPAPAPPCWARCWPAIRKCRPWRSAPA